MAVSKSAKNRAKKNVDVFSETAFTEKDGILSIINKKINIKTKNESQKKAIKLIKEKEITFIAGVAGTGKTFITLATALDLLIDQNTPYNNIYLVKSVTTLPNEELGFLRGDIKEKLEAPMWSFMMNISKLIPESVIARLIESNIVKFLPLAYIRGLSIDNAIIILDETQNLTLQTLRTLMTRIGENAKIIALGDTKQVDIKQKDKSALKIAINLFKDVEEIGVMEFSSDDIVRNPLIKIIEQKFDSYESENQLDTYTKKRIL